MNLKDRIIECLAEKDVKKSELAAATKSPRATISDWTSGKTKKLSGEKLLLAASFFDVNPDWLNSGKGEKKIETAVSRVNIHTQLSGQSNIEPISATTGKVPLISWVSAGSWCEAIDNYSAGDAEDWLPCPAKCSANTYALKVQGDSMTSMMIGAKSYPHGTIIYVDPNIQVISGKSVIAKLPSYNEVTFKVYKEDMGKKWLMPINPQYEKILIDDDVIICGVIIGSFIPE